MDEPMETALESSPDAVPTDAPVLACTGLGKTFSDGKLQVSVLDSVDLEVAAGERIAIIGSSGAGKSTLLHLLGGLDSPSSGTVMVTGRDINAISEQARSLLRNSALGFVYQFHHLLAEFSALENVAMPLLVGGTGVAGARQRAAEMLERVGLSNRMEHKPGELSGGERQRAAVARALVTRPRCVLADEPTGNLDHNSAERVFELMLELNQEFGTSLIMVTHATELASRMERVLRLEDGRLQPA